MREDEGNIESIIKALDFLSFTHRTSFNRIADKVQKCKDTKRFVIVIRLPLDS